MKTVLLKVRLKLIVEILKCSRYNIEMVFIVCQEQDLKFMVLKVHGLKVMLDMKANQFIFVWLLVTFSSSIYLVMICFIFVFVCNILHSWKTNLWFFILGCTMIRLIQNF